MMSTNRFCGPNRRLLSHLPLSGLVFTAAFFLTDILNPSSSHANVITTFKLSNVSPFPVTGQFTYDFTLQKYTSVLFTFPGGVTSNGVPNINPVSISPTTISAAANSGTTGYDMQFNLVTALTPTSGSPIEVDPPGTPIANLNNFVTQDNFGTPTTFAITGGSVDVVPEPAVFLPMVIGAAMLARRLRRR